MSNIINQKDFFENVYNYNYLESLENDERNAGCCAAVLGCVALEEKGKVDIRKFEEENFNKDNMIVSGFLRRNFEKSCVNGIPECIQTISSNFFSIFSSVDDPDKKRTNKQMPVMINRLMDGVKGMQHSPNTTFIQQTFFAQFPRTIYGKDSKKETLDVAAYRPSKLNIPLSEEFPASLSEDLFIFINTLRNLTFLLLQEDSVVPKEEKQIVREKIASFIRKNEKEAFTLIEQMGINNDSSSELTKETVNEMIDQLLTSQREAFTMFSDPSMLEDS